MLTSIMCWVQVFIRTILGLIPFLIVVNSAILSKNSFSQAYNFNYLTIQSGLPQSQAYSLLFDSNQYAWIGTQGGGLCKFDGTNYSYFTKSDSLISNRIYSLKEIDKRIWVGQKGGVSVLDLNGKFLKNLRFENDGIQINDIIFFQKKYLFATNVGVFQLDKMELVKVTDNPGIVDLNVFQFFLTKTNDLWLCTNKGLLNYTNAFGRLTKAKGLTNSHVECAVEFNGEWVMGTYEGGINFFANNQIFQRDQFKALNDKIILTMAVVAEKELWIGTLNDGVFVYTLSDDTLRNYRTSNGLSSNHVKKIAVDYWDNIWLGTSGGGVSIFQNSPFIEYNASSGLNGNYVFSVLSDSKNNLWLGTEGMGVLRMNDTSRVLFDEEYGFKSEKVKTIFEDSKGNIWFGTEGKGIGIFNASLSKDTVISFFNTNGLRANWIKSFAEDPLSNKLYIGTNDGGIYEVDNSKNGAYLFKPIKTKNGGEPKHISHLTFNQGKLWFVEEDGGYGYIQNNLTRKFNEPGRTFRTIVCVNNSIWLGSKDDGILKLTVQEGEIKNKKWINTASKYSISSNNIYQLLYYNQQLWVGTERGLDRLDLNKDDEVIGLTHFGYEEGFEGVETNINANSVGQNGNLWFGTVDGLFVYKGRQSNPTTSKPPILKITDFKIVFESILETPYSSSFKDGKIQQGLKLPYNKNHISFQFLGLHYSHTKNLRYRWKLSEIDPDWTPATTVNIATYPNLPPGKYTFQVQASIDGNWNNRPIQLIFTIDQPFWQKFWFIFFEIAISVFILFLIVLLIIKRQKRRAKIQNEKLTLEKNLLELEQKALRLQMNPHFIFNVLNSIHNLIILNDSDKARYALSKFSKLMRQVLENSREKFISITTEVETLQNYIQLEKLTSNSNIDLLFDFDEDMDTEEEILPPLMIQPFVENALIHGFKGMDKKGEIQVSFKWFHQDILECTISDNGIGRKKASETNAQKTDYHKSTALNVTQERLANLNQNKTFVPFEIIDLVDEFNQPSGTKVVIRIQVV
jgi:ligand-binding sensor domain-containing protein